VIFVWMTVSLGALAGLGQIFGDRIASFVTRGHEQFRPLSSTDKALGLFCAGAAAVGLTLTILVAIDNATVQQVNCVEVVDPPTGGDVTSCQERGGLDWLPIWITGGAHRLKK
jgi:hypothetical protein